MLLNLTHPLPPPKRRKTSSSTNRLSVLSSSAPPRLPRLPRTKHPPSMAAQPGSDRVARDASLDSTVTISLGLHGDPDFLVVTDVDSATNETRVTTLKLLKPRDQNIIDWLSQRTEAVPKPQLRDLYQAINDPARPLSDESQRTYLPELSNPAILLRQRISLAPWHGGLVRTIEPSETDDFDQMAISSPEMDDDDSGEDLLDGYEARAADLPDDPVVEENA